MTPKVITLRGLRDGEQRAKLAEIVEKTPVTCGSRFRPGTIIPNDTVLVGRPPHVLRSASDADRVRLAVLRNGQVNLTRHPGTTILTPPVAGVRMGQFYAYRDQPPASPNRPCCSTRRRSPATSSSAAAQSSASA